MKRFVYSFLVVVMLLATLPFSALAASNEQAYAADRLYQLGLVSGTGTTALGTPNFELDRTPTRSEAITVLVKLLGKEKEASKGGWYMPFTDVPSWAKNFVGYAYANGLTSGTSATTFGGYDPVTPAQYITFVLKALNYKSGTDFQWDKSWVKSDQLGITGGRYNARTTKFTRGDMFFISDAALSAKVKNKSQTLAQQLISAGAFTQSKHSQVYGSPVSTKSVSSSDQRTTNIFLTNFAEAFLYAYPTTDQQLIEFAFTHADMNNSDRLGYDQSTDRTYMTKANMDYILNRFFNKTLSPSNGTRFGSDITYKNNKFYCVLGYGADSQYTELAIAHTVRKNSDGTARIEFDIFSYEDPLGKGFSMSRFYGLTSKQAFAHAELDWSLRGYADVAYRSDGTMYLLRYHIV